MPNSNASQPIATEAIVIGGGLAGLTAGIALASAGVATVLIAKSSQQADHRTTALLAGSVAALEALGVWARCRDRSAPLTVMRLVDDRPGLLRAPEVAFRAEEIGLGAFGHNIANADLVRALEARASEIRNLTKIDGVADAVTPSDDGVTVALDDSRRVAARLAIGADGRRSIARAAAGIETDVRRYPQTALTFNLAHTRPHRNASTEFHTPTGPFTLVPLPGQHSSLVWVADPVEAEAFAQMDDAGIAAEIERRSHSILGKIKLLPGRGFFPLAVETATRFAANRVALVGEAAHVIPPIGAQGFNLGLRDAATIAELVAEARRAGTDIGAPDLFTRYDRLRRPDVGTRTLAVDLLNRSLLTDFLPVHGMRGFGLYLLDRIGPLRRAVMQEGVAPRASKPRLMRGEAL